MAGNQNNTGGSMTSGEIMFAGIGMIIFMVLLLIWILHKYDPGITNFVALLIIDALLYPFYWSAPAREIIQHISETEAVSWTPHELAMVYGYAASEYGRWLILPFMVYYVLKIRKMSIRDSFKQTHSIKSLTAIFAEANPALKPLTYIDPLKEKVDNGPWEAPRTPLQWAVKHGLMIGQDSIGAPEKILDEKYFFEDGMPILYEGHSAANGLHPLGGYVFESARFNTDAAKKILIEQLYAGLPPEQGIMKPDASNLPNYVYAIMVSALLYASGDKTRSKKILDVMSLQWRPPREGAPAQNGWKGFPLKRIQPSEYTQSLEPGAADEDLVRAGGFEEEMSMLNFMQAVESYRKHLTRQIGNYIFFYRVPNGFRDRETRRLKFQWVPAFAWTWTLNPFVKAVEARDQIIPEYPDMGELKVIFEKAKKNRQVEKIFKIHGYWVGSFMMSIMEYAQTRGGFITANMIWLRPVNQTLFALLNQVGGQTDWVVSSACASHNEYESVLNTEYIIEPQVDGAIEGVKNAIQKEGWIP